MDALTIGRAARQAGVNVETIRFYERRRLIKQPPKSGGFRLYPPATIARVCFIRRAQQVGFSLRQIEELLSLKADPESDCAHVRERAMAKVEEVNRKIAELERVRSALEKVIASCPGHGALHSCSILEALDNEPQPQRASSPEDRTEERS
jgi:MerR family copper efflux transcriptional regulator